MDRWDRLAVPLSLSLSGATLLSLVGGRYRIDALRCSSWPSLQTNLWAAALFLLAVSLLSVGWLRLLRLCQREAGPSARQIVCAGMVLYFVAGMGPPALSDDPLFYAALGRAQAEYQASPYQPLCQSMPADDALLQRLIPHWRCGRSPYQAGFHVLASGLAWASRGSLVMLLRCFQAVAGLSLLAAGGLTALALRGSTLRPAYGAALVVFNPLSVIEGPASAHNDALLALSCAGFVLAWQRGQRGGVLLAHGAGLLVKVSSLLLSGLLFAALALRRLAPQLDRVRQRRGFRGLLVLSAALALLGLGGWLFYARPEALFGPSHLPWEHCTRSIECLPRSILRSILHRPREALFVGVASRLLAGIWLGYVAWRASQQPHGLLRWLGAGLLIYYLYLHPWSQSWYLLSLLPLAPWLGLRMSRALRVVSISACAYYAAVLVGNCLEDELAIAAFDLVEALIVLVPPTVSLLRQRQDG